jgi:dihydrofolate reductase
MTRTRYYTATAIDGYIADEHNSLDWLFEVPGEGDSDEPEGFADFFSGIGAFALGATTYEWMLAHEEMAAKPEKWQRWYGSTPVWVFTHRELPRIPGVDITFVQGDVRSVRRDMAAAAGDGDIWLMGGGELVGSFADEGLLDELVLTVAPVTLGAGAPLLPRRLTSARLKLTGVQQRGQFAELRYAVG